jgi:hypothetical protein
MKVNCRRCGKCCILFNGEKWIECPYLFHTSRKITLCTIYSRRLGKQIGYGYVCNRRKNLKYNIPECPYNKKGLKTHPAYIIDHGEKKDIHQNCI